MSSPIACLRSDTGTVPVRAQRFVDEVGPIDDAVLARAVPPVLDIGCGPGRHVVALGQRRRMALGIDITPAALTLARRKGAPVLERSVFERIPGSGRWATALLLDGNLGIGADPVALLARVFTLLRRGGEVLVETRPPGHCGGFDHLQFEIDGVAGPWFAWSVIGADELPSLAARADCDVVDLWNTGARWFGALRRG